MHQVLLAVDRINAWIGKTFSWCIIVLTFAVTYDVLARYLFRAPTEWAYDVSYMLYGALFMMAGAYTLARNGHVRGDVFYRTWSPRAQAIVDLTCYVLFCLPGVVALIYSGYGFAKLSWLMNEHSYSSPGGPPVYHFKSLIPIAGALLLLQGLAEIIRCVECIRSGRWPQRLHDVEEMEKVALERAAAQRSGAEGRTGA
jgi:TRAP-type mannitol/chloroaromatic compound transport system permease small subunit